MYPTIPRLTVVRTYKNKLMDYVTTRLRSSHGADVIGHREAAFPVLRALRKNGYAAFLADHNTSRSEAFFLPFLGEEAAVNKGPAVLAVRAKALVWPIALIRDGDRYRIIIEEPLDTALLEGDAEEKRSRSPHFIRRPMSAWSAARPINGSGCTTAGRRSGLWTID